MRYNACTILLLLLCPLVPLPVYAVAAEADSALVVMNLAAHPDDEDGRTLAYYRWARDARAYSVIYTRGEGGQNEIGPELYEELGVIRTAETERAARILGTQVFYLNFKDFGYSKSADETFEAWGGRDSVTARLTYLIRKLKPDVLFTNHDTVTVGPGRQHGHHQAVGLSAYDAFARAADPAYHPEQLREEGVDLWQPKRLFLRHWNRPERVDVVVPVGSERVPDLTAAEIAGDALREHASQGMDRFAGRFATPATYFTLLRRSDDTPLDSTDLAGNLVPSGSRPAPLRYLIDSGRIDPLAENAITTSDSVGVPGRTLRITWDTSLLPPLPLRLRLSGAVDTTLMITRDTPPAATLRLRRNATATIPERQHQYDRLISSPPIAYELHSLAEGVRTHAGYLPVEVALPFSVASGAEVLRLKDGAASIPLSLTAWDTSLSEITVRAAVASPTTNEVLGERYVTYRPSGRRPVLDTLRVGLGAETPEGDYVVVLTARSSEPIRTEHLTVAARSYDVDAPRSLRVGVVESYDDALSHALQELEVDHSMLDSTMLASGDLSQFHTIVLDIRAYLVRPGLRAHNDRLLAWVRQGGHLVVNYHKTMEWDGETYPPYPLRLSRLRVTREDAPVRILLPEHVLFHQPNRVRSADWDGWVQERGLYFPDAYDDRYVELFAMSDPGEPELRGSTLLASYGEGTYLYTALVWYRQLKLHHPGAFRVFANMISLPLVDGRVETSTIGGR